MSSSERCAALRARRSFSPRVTVLAALLACAAVVSGCGFRLQGASMLPADVKSVHLVLEDALSPFGVELRRRFEASGAKIQRSPEGADLVVRVLSERSGRKVLSVSARNTPKEYELYYTVEYSIDHGGKEAVPRQELSMTRNISFEATQLLAKDREERILREALARDLADLVFRRVESL